MKWLSQVLTRVGYWVVGGAMVSGLLVLPPVSAQVVRVVATESPAKNRLNVLVIQGAEKGLDLVRLQSRLDDLAWVYRVQMSNPSGGLIAEIDAWLTFQTWDVVYFDFAYENHEGRLNLAVDSEAVRGMVARLIASGAVCIWGTAATSIGAVSKAESVVDSDRLQRVLTEEGVLLFDGIGAGDSQATQPISQLKRVDVLAEEMIAQVSAKKGQSLKLSTESRERLSRLLEDEGSLSDPLLLPEPPRRDAVVFRGGKGGHGSNLHPYIAFHGGVYWCVWASGSVDATTSKQDVQYATSKDGVIWDSAFVLAEDPDGPSGPWQWVSSGLSVIDGNLTAFATLHRGRSKNEVWADARVERFVWSKDRWVRQGVLAKDCLIYYPPMRVAGGDFVVWRSPSAHFLTAVRKAGEKAWAVKPLPGPFPDYRMSEATHYLDPEGRVHLIIRDQGASGFVYHTVSYDGGETWAVPVKTNLPDAMSKNYADRLSNGWYYFINNPKNSGPYTRDCLTIVFSRNGWSYGHPKLLRKEAPAVRHAGGSKITHSYQHAHATEHAGRLWVVYTTNMEDIEIASYAIGDFKLQ